MPRTRRPACPNGTAEQSPGSASRMTRRVMPGERSPGSHPSMILPPTCERSPHYAPPAAARRASACGAYGAPRPTLGSLTSPAAAGALAGGECSDVGGEYGRVGPGAVLGCPVGTTDGGTRILLLVRIHDVSRSIVAPAYRLGPFPGASSNRHDVVTTTTRIRSSRPASGSHWPAPWKGTSG